MREAEFIIRQITREDRGLHPETREYVVVYAYDNVERHIRVGEADVQRRGLIARHEPEIAFLASMGLTENDVLSWIEEPSDISGMSKISNGKTTYYLNGGMLGYLSRHGWNMVRPSRMK